MLHDSSVIRNFCVLDWLDVLLELNRGHLLVVPDVAAPIGEPSEMGDRLSTFDRILTLSRGGSPEGSRALVAVQAIKGFLARIGSEVATVMPSPEATKLARRMLDPSSEDRQVFGLGVRRLSAAEAVSVCVALELQVGLATDDKAAAGVYRTLGGHHHKWTLDLFRDAVTAGLLSESEARRGYLHLIEIERFRGIPWD